MKFNEKYNIEKGAEDLFSFNSEKEENLFNAKIIMFKFLSEIHKLNASGKFKKKELAELLGTSPSYITQLYRGDKLTNLLMLAKLEDIFNIEFEIKARPLEENSVVIPTTESTSFVVQMDNLHSRRDNNEAFTIKVGGLFNVSKEQKLAS